MKQILHRVDSLVCPKNSNNLRSHLRAIMTLDHRRLGLENKSGRIFCVRQVYFTKSCQQMWGCVNQPFILFIHNIWGETVWWGAVFIIQTGRSKHAWAFSETVKKNFQNHLHGQPVLMFDKRRICSASFRLWIKINRVALRHNNEFIMFIFFSYLMVS